MQTNETVIKQIESMIVMIFHTRLFLLNSKKKKTEQKNVQMMKKKWNNDNLFSFK